MVFSMAMMDSYLCIHSQPYFTMTERMGKPIGLCQECGQYYAHSISARCDYEYNGCCEPELLCEFCGGADDMVTSTLQAGLYHPKCVPFEWGLYDAFDRNGFTGGENRRNYTYLVKEAIEAIGYTVEACNWGFDNLNCIKRITRISDDKGVYGQFCADGEYGEWPDCAEYPEYKLIQDCCDNMTCPHHRWLSAGRWSRKTMAEALPEDICKTLAELQKTIVAKQIVGFVPITGFFLAPLDRTASPDPTKSR